MIKKRLFILGLGTGLIAGALLLQLALIGQAQTVSSMNTTELTREQLEEAAARLDLKVIEGSEELMTEDEWREKVIEQGNKTPADPTAPDTANPSQEPSTPAVPQSSPPKEKGNQQPTAAVKAVNTPKEAAAPQQAKAAKQLVTFRIAPGKNLTAVAEELEKSGVVESASDFMEAATAKKINRKIRSGTYTLEKGESLNSIITKFTTVPSR
ncbi:YceG-like family protein [compost metagenome]